MFRIGKNVLLLGLAAATLLGCGRRDNVVEDQGPELLYQRGFDAMDASNFAGAIQYFNALEARYPMLCGTIRDQTSGKRRAMVRFYACEQDFSNESPDTQLPDAIAEGKEPLLIIGAIAGG